MVREYLNMGWSKPCSSLKLIFEGATMNREFEVVQLTEIGDRGTQQDRASWGTMAGGHNRYALFDGAGGRSAGGEAAAIAAREIEKQCNRRRQNASTKPSRILVWQSKVLHKANEAILDAVIKHDKLLWDAFDTAM